MWFAILAFAVACTALVAVGAVLWLLMSVTTALTGRARPAPAEELIRQ